MAERTRSDDPYLNLPEDASLSGELLDTQVQKAQEQLVALKRQQDIIERQKRELEELSRRQDQLHSGKTEMIEKLTRALVVLEREHLETQRRVDLLTSINDSFNGHLDQLEAINPKAWEGLDINKELAKALSAVDDARSEFARSLPKIGTTPSDEADLAGAAGPFHADYEATSAKDFLYWLKAGVAFTLPLVVIGLLLVWAISNAKA